VCCCQAKYGRCLTQVTDVAKYSTREEKPKKKEDKLKNPTFHAAKLFLRN